MAHLNKELQARLNTLNPVNKELLEKLLLDINMANMESEKTDAITQLHSKVREIILEGENK